MAERESAYIPNEPEPDEDVVHLLRVIEIQGTVSWQEIEDVLADGGYSADTRKNLLTEVLTRLAQADHARLSPEARDVVDKVKGVLEEYQTGKPATTDVL